LKPREIWPRGGSPEFFEGLVGGRREGRRGGKAEGEDQEDPGPTTSDIRPKGGSPSLLHGLVGGRRRQGRTKEEEYQASPGRILDDENEKREEQKKCARTENFRQRR
jgi:hypothetical protein